MCVCVLIHMQGITQKYQQFVDLVTSVRQGKVPADKRVQVKMPEFVLSELDAQFPDQERSQVLTQLVVDALERRLKFADREIYQAMTNSEQTMLDTMASYLEERDRESKSHCSQSRRYIFG